MARAASITSSTTNSAPAVGHAALLPVYLFMLALVLPADVQVFLGPMRLFVYRVLLILALLPCMARLLSGRAGPLTAVDALILVLPLWVTVTLLYHHGFAAWEATGIHAIETVVPFLLARTCIRSPEAFERVVRLFLILVILLIPFTCYEAVTGKHVLREAFGGYVESRPQRLGLDRAYGPFEHPIHYGVFCASGAGLVLYVLQRRASVLAAAARYGVIAIGTFFSLSSGPLVALVAQTGLATWERMTRRLARRWLLLTGLAVAGWIVVDMISNRTPFHVLVTYFTFNLGSAYNRILIWVHGIASVAEHPLFGIGFGEWARPYWMSSSMDNFWLLVTVRHGLPALLLLGSAVLLLCLRLGRLPIADAVVARHRKGWMVTIVGLIVVGATVHFWSALYVWFMFLLGCGAWMLERGEARPAARRQPASGFAAETSPARFGAAGLAGRRQAGAAGR